MTIADSSGFHTTQPENYFIERFAQAYRLEMDAFIELLRHGTAPLAGIRDGLEAQRLAEAAQVSLQRGQPVELSSDWVPN
ncbi:Gfo/Idh/MocA family oxidoreductase [Marinobacterium sedimentorum]|uniref:Gfo/Idh/MocA family oxidoreductase n=1 Tax=Marinobacterium sedimentorum TaxID=2927804 RepID=UPI00211503F2|nr:Gfo/Idh/MocA family oxidoreductase [Marinobacterium sedimentorum]